MHYCMLMAKKISTSPQTYTHIYIHEYIHTQHAIVHIDNKGNDDFSPSTHTYTHTRTQTLSL